MDMRLNLPASFRLFGTLIVLTIIMSACSSTYQMTSYNDDDVYHTQKNTQVEMTTVDEDFEEYESPQEQQTTTEEQSRKNSRSREINRSILSGIGYALLEGLYIFTLWCN